MKLQPKQSTTGHINLEKYKNKRGKKVDKVFTVELTLSEWIEVIIAVNELSYSKKVYEKNEEKANEEIKIVDIIQKQILLGIELATKK